MMQMPGGGGTDLIPCRVAEPGGTSQSWAENGRAAKGGGVGGSHGACLTLKRC